MPVEVHYQQPHVPFFYSSLIISGGVAGTTSLLIPPLPLPESSSISGTTTFLLHAGVMSRRNGGNAPKLDLKLNLSPTRRNTRGGHESPSRSSSVSPTSPPSSCVSSEENCFSNSPDQATSMVVAGCPHCLMYVLLPEKDPRCPKCQSTVLVGVFNDNGNGSNTKKN